MARASSVILTPAEKKLAVNNAKEAAKLAKTAHASLAKDRAALDKAHAANLKELEKNYKAAVATATKTYAATAKESDKALKAAAIALTKADADDGASTLFGHAADRLLALGFIGNFKGQVVLTGFLFPLFDAMVGGFVERLVKLATHIKHDSRLGCHGVETDA